MCGRYAATSRPEDLIEEFEIEVDRTAEPSRSVLAAPQDPPPGQPDFNVAPTKQAAVVLTRADRRRADRPEDADQPARRQLRLMTWGLVPGWAKDTKVGLRMINARGEDVLEKSAFSKAALTRRAIVPADGWYEWQPSPTAVDRRGKPRKQPFFIHRSDGHTTGFAALYEFWRDRSKEQDDPAAWLTTYAIITTAAEPGLDRIHDRQPLVLEPPDWGTWLDPAVQDPEAVGELLAFSAPGRFDAYPVDQIVNSARNNGPELLRPLQREELDGVVDPMTGEVIGGGRLGRLPLG